MVKDYSRQDYEQIAEALGDIDVDVVMQFQHRFEAAALWHQLTTASPKRAQPAQLSKRLKRIEAAARKLLTHLGVYDPVDAPDGPAEMTILEFLASASDSSEDDVIRATARIGRLVEILEAIRAAQDIERRARKAARDAIEVGDLIVPKEHRGEAAANGWIKEMIQLYREISGRKPGTSVDPIDGTAGGPLIRFLQAAGDPLGIVYSAAAWRKRIREILKVAGG